ncbi:MAG: hypothetical protein U0936_13225 [Planctomycetaceae bacterium]
MADIPKIPDREITPPSVYANRRAFMRAGVAAATAAATGSVYRLFNPIKHVDTSKAAPVELQAATESEAELLANGWRVDEEKTPEQSILTYNNFYEFTTNKEAVASVAAGFTTEDGNWLLMGWLISLAHFRLPICMHSALPRNVSIGCDVSKHGRW